MILETKLKKGVTKTREVASQVPSRSLSSAQHLGNFALAGAGFGAGMVMNAKSHFQNVGSFFTNKGSEHQPDEVLPAETLETPISPDAPEPNIPKTKPALEGIKPVEEKTTNSFNGIPNHSGANTKFKRGISNS